MEVMVKNINIALDDNDHARLTKAKGDKTWPEFIMQLADEVPQETDPATK